MRQLVLAAAFFVAGNPLARPVQAEFPLDGKTRQVELSSSQGSSGYGDDFLPPLHVLEQSNLKPAGMGPGADVVFDVVTHSDVGH